MTQTHAHTQFGGLPALPTAISAFLAVVYLRKQNADPDQIDRAKRTFRETAGGLSAALLRLGIRIADGETINSRDDTYIHQAVRVLALWGVQCDSQGLRDGFTAFVLSGDRFHGVQE